jgi:hypothetical protein
MTQSLKKLSSRSFSRRGLSRRGLLKSVVSAFPPITAFLSEVSASFDDSQAGCLYISGARRAADEYLAVVFDERGELRARVPLLARAHGAASHRYTHRACIFARRPGMFLNTFDLRQPSMHMVNIPVSGRHFYGHGTYSENGDFLYATENDYESARGVLGIYDATKDYQRIGELDTAGVGPHEVVRVPGAPLLVIANGGIQTHPDSGRDKLNIETMQPSLTLIDTRTGKIVGRHVLPDELHQVSIRHLACSDDGDVWFAGQYEGGSPVAPGLVGSISVAQSVQSFAAGQSRKGLVLIDLPASMQSQASHYISSVAVIGAHAVFTASKGGMTFKVNRLTHEIDQSYSIMDCSGVAGISVRAQRDTDGVLVTSGTGDILIIKDDELRSLTWHNLQWDNHVYQA